MSTDVALRADRGDARIAVRGHLAEGDPTQDGHLTLAGPSPTSTAPPAVHP